MGDIELEVFSTRLRELRQNLGMTQAEFVENLGITASALSSYEKNIKNPSISVAKKIATEYGVSIDWLCGLSEKKEIVNNDFFYSFSDIVTYIYNLDKNNFIENFSKVYQTFSNNFKAFLSEYTRMWKLKEEGVIDQELFDLWFDKNITAYGMHIVDPL
ncbi:XRE family transcriptional regulator [Ruminococcus sp. AF18-22]|nr:XRE family transcriptional regulator [Ruminococcus sp. AF18-22]